MSLEEKQQYLCQEIIDGGYSPEQFQEFLETKKPEAGIDLNLWSFEELKQVVKQFRKSHKPIGQEQVAPLPPPPPPPPMPQKQQSNKEVSKDGKVEKQPEPKSPIGKPSAPRGEDDEVDTIDPISGQDLYVRLVPGIKVDMAYVDGPMTVIMKKFEKNEGGLFQQDYVSYYVETPQKGWMVGRRYTQFQWLRETLDKMFPGLPVPISVTKIPPIPKKGHFRNFEESHLHRRMNALESFLNKVLSMPQLNATTIVVNFLRISDGAEYLKYKKDHTIEENRVPLNKLRSPKGRVRLAIEPEMTKLFTQFRQTFTSTEQRLNKIYKDSKMVFTNMEQSAKLVEGLSGAFMELSEESARFVKTADIQPDKTTGAELYRTIGALTRDLSKLMNDQAVCFKQHIYGLYKYEMHNIIAMSQCLKRVDEAKEEYNQFKLKLRKTKEKLIEDKNYSKWGLPLVQSEKLAKDKNAFTRDELMAMMLPKETEQQTQLRDYYALINATLYDEIIRYTRDNPAYLTNNLLALSKKESSISSAEMMLWADVMSFFKYEQGKVHRIDPPQKPPATTK